MLLKALVISALLGVPLALAEVGTIEKVGVGPTVKVTRAGAALHLKAGDDLKAGDEVSTDATTAVDIRLEDETLIRLGVNSSYKVQEDSKLHALVHRLLSGVVRVLVKPTDRDHTDPHIKFRMFTQEGTIGVRGTEFVVTRNGGTTEIKGLDGEVLFGAADADLSNLAGLQLVTRGFQSSIGAGAKTAAKPEKFDLKKYLDEVNGKSSAAFGPLAGGGGASKPTRYERAALAAPIAVQVTAKAANTSAASIPTPKQPVAVAKASQKLDGDKLQDQLVAAVLDNNVKGIREALEMGAHINRKSKLVNATPLQAALSSARSEAEKKTFLFLMEQGPDVNLEDNEHLTPLMYAAEHKLSMEYVRTLVDPGGADYTKTNESGDTAESIATKVGFTEMALYMGSKEIKTDYDNGLEAQEAVLKAHKKNVK
jgi:hypothetical protein